MGDDEPAVVEDEVTRQTGKERLDIPAEPCRLLLELLERNLEPSGNLDRPAAQGPEQLVVVIADRHGQGPGFGHGHRDPEQGRDRRAAIHQVPGDHEVPAGRRRPDAACRLRRPAEQPEKVAELRQAAVHVGQDVEAPRQAAIGARLHGPDGSGR